MSIEADRAKVAAILAGLPEIRHVTSHGNPSINVGKRFLTWVREPGVLVLALPIEEKEMLMSLAPDIYFETDHYRGWPAVLIRLEAIPEEELRQRLLAAWERLMQKRALGRWKEAGGG
ncbi:MAG TPA: MmcQ/YjbR family DNA-binding protein [Paracoccaceae bacterium]|nr:MmcQ/YjbR family DNA-binding protein [Paracoccaceae bacterium]